MEQFSRVKKYEQLRNDIEQNDTSSNASEQAILEITKPQEAKESYTPSHEKEVSFIEENKTPELDSTFKNEYLDSFIQEVREYNIKKGVREYEDTKLDILQQLNSKNRERRASYVEKIEEEPRDVSSETMEISKQVFDLLNEEETGVVSEPTAVEEMAETFVSEPVIQEEVAMEEVVAKPQEPTVEVQSNRVSSELEARIASLESQLVETTQQMKMSQNDREDDFDTYSKKELIEQTQKLKVQMDEYKDELEGLNTGIDSNNKLLNIIITILIVALLAVIGVVVYWLVSGGII